MNIQDLEQDKDVHKIVLEVLVSREMKNIITGMRNKTKKSTV